jgi:hypothetical protein
MVRTMCGNIHFHAGGAICAVQDARKVLRRLWGVTRQQYFSRKGPGAAIKVLILSANGNPTSPAAAMGCLCGALLRQRLRRAYFAARLFRAIFRLPEWPAIRSCAGPSRLAQQSMVHPKGVEPLTCFCPWRNMQSIEGKQLNTVANIRARCNLCCNPKLHGLPSEQSNGQ